MRPTTFTPPLSSWNHHASSVVTTTITSGAGQRGSQWRISTSAVTTASPSSSVGTCVWPTFAATSHSCPVKAFDLRSSPSIRASWLPMMMSAAPLT